MALSVGEPGPWFSAATPSNPSFDFDTMGGRYVLLAFLPPADQGRAAVLQAVTEHRAMFDDVKISAFVVITEDAEAAQVRDMRGLRWFLDPEGRISRLYQARDADGAQKLVWILLDPTLRVCSYATQANTPAMMRVLAGLPPIDDHAATALHAPVLMLPRVFEPELCERLIALFNEAPRDLTGVMQDAGERTVAVMDRHKARRDVTIFEPGLVEALRERLEQRVFPDLARSFQFEATRIERYIVSCYDAADGGVFHPHRDNTTKGTAYRRFACSINLNEDFTGGDLRFPEFGGRLYRPPPGGAVAFSCSLLHEVTPVSAGRRYAFLPFVYDEAAQAVLDAYRRSVAGA